MKMRHFALPWIEPKTFFLFFCSLASMFYCVPMLSVCAEKFNSIGVTGFRSLALASLMKF